MGDENPYGSGGGVYHHRGCMAGQAPWIPPAYDPSFTELLVPLIISPEVRPGDRRPDLFKCVIEIAGTEPAYLQGTLFQLIERQLGEMVEVGILFADHMPDRLLAEVLDVAPRVEVLHTARCQGIEIEG